MARSQHFAMGGPQHLEQAVEQLTEIDDPFVDDYRLRGSNALVLGLLAGFDSCAVSSLCQRSGPAADESQ
jgi:hypothetical protein